MSSRIVDMLIDCLFKIGSIVFVEISTHTEIFRMLELLRVQSGKEGPCEVGDGAQRRIVP